MSRTRVVGWGPFPWPGEKKRRERAEREATELMELVHRPREKWRVGEHYGIHVYAGDRPVGTFHDPADALRAVTAVNERTTDESDQRNHVPDVQSDHRRARVESDLGERREGTAHPDAGVESDPPPQP